MVCGPTFFLPTTSTRRHSCIYVDGFNLHHRCLQPLGSSWLNRETFFRALRQDDDLQRIWYSTAEWEGKRSPAQKAYHAALGTTPLVQVVFGKFQTQYLDCEVAACQHGGERRYFHSKEKRTDVNSALQMVTDALQNRCELLVLVSGDSDPVPAVRQVRALGKEVIVYVPAKDETVIAANELRQQARVHAS